jgi:hypothetical protein
MAKIATHKDHMTGRMYRVLLPDGANDDEAQMGIIVGPPDLDSLGLPERMQTELHNRLFLQGVFTLKDTRARRGDVIAALQGTLKLDAERIIQCYRDADSKVVIKLDEVG